MSAQTQPDCCHPPPGSASAEMLCPAGSRSVGTREAGARRLVVGISGASGVVYGLHLLNTLRRLDLESHVVMSRTAGLTLALETATPLTEVRQAATAWYAVDDLTAPIASGSFPCLGMIIAPCSVRTMSEIATGMTQSLLTRAADVALKERRRLVLMVRETPLHLGHLRTMTALTEMGAVIAPPVPAFYSRPQTIDDILDHTVGRVLDLFGIDSGRVGRWLGPGGGTVGGAAEDTRET